jgi:cysteine desulfurase
MVQCLGPDAVFANAASTHGSGLVAKGLIEQARSDIAARVGAHADEIVFTSGATESNNLALKGTFGEELPHNSRLLTTRIEHKSVLDSAEQVARRGVAVGYLVTDACGRVDLDALASTLQAKATALVSVMHVNNEIGTWQEIEAIAALCRAHGALLHVDAAQSVGKLPVLLEDWGVDFCSLTAHKICGPKGIGALYVRRGRRLAAQLHGGGHEHGLRAGTLATHQIVGMGASYALAEPASEMPEIERLSQRLWAGLAAIEGVARNGSAATSIPNIVNVRFPGVDGESLRLALADLAVSAGSACNSADVEPSYVLKSLGLSDVAAAGSLRFSIGRFTTESEIDRAVERATEEVSRLRSLAPNAPNWCLS